MILFRVNRELQSYMQVKKHHLIFKPHFYRHNRVSWEYTHTQDIMTISAFISKRYLDIPSLESLHC